MGPGVFLLPLSLIVCSVGSALSLRRLLAGRPAKWTWVSTGAVSLCAALAVVGYAEAKAFLDNLAPGAAAPRDPLIALILSGRGGPRRLWYGCLLLGALGLACWGGFLTLRGMLEGSPMTMRRALIAVLLTTTAFALLGLAIGFGLGSLAPNFYRDTFEDGHSAEFDPVAMGVGLGVTQGAAGGAFIGLVLVCIRSWYETRASAQGK